MAESGKKTLKLEAGKRYVTRSGWITPPLQFDDEFEQTYPFVCGTSESRSWMPNGMYFSGDEESGNVDDEDLVAEFVVDGSIVPGVPEGFRITERGPMKLDVGRDSLTIGVLIERIDP